MADGDYFNPDTSPNSPGALNPLVPPWAAQVPGNLATPGASPGPGNALGGDAAMVPGTPGKLLNPELPADDPSNMVFQPLRGVKPVGAGPGPVPAAVAAPVPIGSVDKTILDKIASGEAHDYTTIYTPPGSKGINHFSSFVAHPQQRFVIPDGPHKGETSDAAGRYQFLSSTWNPIAKKLGLKDFSPASQDAGALDLAKTTYKTTTGRDLESDVASGKVKWSALSGQWPSLSKASGPLPATERVEGGQGAGTTATPSLGDNDVAAPAAAAGSARMNPMLAMMMLQTMAPQHQFQPVDYDPYKVMPKMGA